MAAMTDKLENVLIDWLFRAQAANVSGYMTNASAAAGTGPTSLYIALFTANPTDVAGGTEVSTSGTAYARVQVTSSLANWAGTLSAGSTAVSTGVSGTTSNNIAITFPAPTGSNWGTVTGFAAFDASTAGNMLIWGALTSSKTVNAGDAAPSFAAGALTFQIDN